MGRKKSSDAHASSSKKTTTLQDVRKQLPIVCSKQDQVNDALERLQTFIERYPNVLNHPKNKQKSINLHSNLLKASETQADILRKILADIEKVHKRDYKSRTKSEMKRKDLMELIEKQGQSMPLWINDDEEFPKESVGAIAPSESSKLNPGDLVAAHSKGDWILAEIVSCQSSTRYECRDIEDDQKKVSVMSRHRLVPLPKWRADPLYDKHALFPVDAIVLALYPQTTCFYKGIVHEPPADSTEPYGITFEDSSYEYGYSPPMPVCQKYVVTYKEIRTGKKRETDE